MRLINHTLAIGCLVSVMSIQASTLVIEVENVKSSNGEIGCALFNSADGFPMTASYVQQQWIKANEGTVSCQFEQVVDGTYAVSVSHDENSNRKTDTNFFGIPKEDWGVTNNVRPKLRAPTFEEAKFDLSDNMTLTVSID